ncbi:hypothetical protein FQN57_006873 [Myotisia sp. PD_48]|nr:hypothetical protein FQN57_006873 [Myotisia sp. PD_48]
MGCCFSRNPDNSPYSPGASHHGDSSSRAINPDPTAINSPTSQSQSRGSTPRPHRRIPQPLPLSVPFNQPIRPHVWQSKSRLWSRAHLDREREEFFDTRVTGRSEVWAALSTAITLMREGDLVTAQSIIDAAGVTVPTGDLCEGCYDENGALYRLPETIVSDPVNIITTTESDVNLKLGSRATTAEGDAISSAKLVINIDSDGDELDNELETYRGEKGKRNERDYIKVIARLSDRGGPDVTVSIWKDQTVGLLARKIQDEVGLTGKRRVRIAYLGKILKEHHSLSAQGWKEGNVVNALVMNAL